jgi:hypothetical protein
MGKESSDPSCSAFSFTGRPVRLPAQFRGEKPVKGKGGKLPPKKMENRSIDWQDRLCITNWLRLEKVLILDRQKDTLLYAGDLYVRIKLLKLLSNTVDITTVDLKNASFNLRREQTDTAFNLQFILDSFASSTPEKENKDTASKPMQLSVKQLTLDHVRFSLKDKKSGLFVFVNVNELSCLPELLNPDQANYNIGALGIHNCQVILIDSSKGTKLPENIETGKSDPAALLLSINQLGLRDIFLSFQKPADNINYSLRVDSLSMLRQELDLGHQIASVKSVRISNTDIRLLESKIASAKVQKETPVLPEPASQQGWKIRIDDIAVINNSFSYHNSAFPERKGIDANHLEVRNFNLHLGESSYDPSGLSTSLDEGSFLFNQQINVKHLHSGFRLTDSLLELKDAALAINRSEFRSKGTISLPLAPGTYPVPASQFIIETLSVNYGDVLLAAPALTKQLPFSFLPSDQFKLSGKLSVTGQQIAADQLRLSMSRNLFSLNGGLALQRNRSGQFIRADFRQFQLKRELLANKQLQQLKASGLNLPATISVTGNLRAGNDILITDLDLNSTFGQIALNGTAKNISHPERLAYDFQLKPRQFETGKWIGLDSIAGKITGEMTIKGSGIDPRTMIAMADLELSSVEFNRDHFSGVDLEAELNRSKFSLGLQTMDPKLQTTVNLQGHLNPDYLVEGSIHVAHADLKQLRLTTDSLLYSGYLRLHAVYNQPHTIDAEIKADSNSITVGSRNFKTEAFLFLCRSDADSTILLANAPFLNAQLKSNFPLNQIGTESSALRERLYPPEALLAPISQSPGLIALRISLALELAEDSLLGALFPGLSLLQPITLTGNYDSGEERFHLSLQALAPCLRISKLKPMTWPSSQGPLTRRCSLQCQAGRS